MFKVKKSVVFVFALLGIISIAGIFLLQKDPLLSNSELTTIFHENRASFSRLERLFAESKDLQFITEAKSHYLDPKGNETIQQTSREDSQAIGQAGILFGFREKIETGEAIKFTVSRKRLAGDHSETSYDEKGFIFFADCGDDMIASLKQKNRFGNMNIEYLDQKWFIFSEKVVSKPE